METADAVRRSQDYRPCLAASRRVKSHERVAILHQTVSLGIAWTDFRLSARLSHSFVKQPKRVLSFAPAVRLWRIRPKKPNLQREGTSIFTSELRNAAHDLPD